MGKAWTREEDETLKRFIATNGPGWEGWKELLPGRTPNAIMARKIALGLQGPRGKVRSWSDAEDAVVREHFGTHPSSWSGWGKLLPDRSGNSIRKRAEALGIKGVGSGANNRRGKRTRRDAGIKTKPSTPWTDDQRVALVKAMSDMVDVAGHDVKDCLYEFARIVRAWRASGKTA